MALPLEKPPDTEIAGDDAAYATEAPRTIRTADRAREPAGVLCCTASVMQIAYQCS